MTGPVAIVVTCVLVVALVVPLALAYRYPKTRAPVALLYGVLLAGLTVHHVGLSFGAVQPVAAAVPGEIAVNDSGELKERCTQAIDLAKQGALIRDSSSPDRLVVDGALWKQLPDDVQKVLVMCVERTRQPGQGTGNIEVVQQ